MGSSCCSTEQALPCRCWKKGVPKCRDSCSCKIYSQEFGVKTCRSNSPPPFPSQEVLVALTRTKQALLEKKIGKNCTLCWHKAGNPRRKHMEEAQPPDLLSPGLRNRAGITDVQMEEGEVPMEWLSKEQGSLIPALSTAPC